MPAKSKSQQRLMAMVHAYKNGKLKDAPGKIKDVAKHISDDDARDFARTKRTGLPEKSPEKKAEWRDMLDPFGLKDLYRRWMDFGERNHLIPTN